MLNTEIVRNTEGGRKRVSEIDDGQQWFADLKQRMRKGRVTEVTILSPSRAAALLAANPDNRAMSEGIANTYAADIATGRWVFNGEPLIIANTGELNDGQHRCRGVVLAGKAIEVLIVAGVPRASRTTVDMGKVRHVGDFLHMHGIPDATNVASCAAIVLAYETDRMAGRGATGKKAKATTNSKFYSERITKQEVLTFANDIMPDVQRAMKAIDRHKCHLVGTYSRLSGFLCILGRHSRDWNAASAFVASIVDGNDLKKGMPAFAARERLLQEKQARTLGAPKLFEIVGRAWNAHRKGEKISRMQLSGFIPALSR